MIVLLPCTAVLNAAALGVFPDSKIVFGSVADGAERSPLAGDRPGHPQDRAIETLKFR